MGENVYTFFMKFIFVGILVFIIIIALFPFIISFFEFIGITADGFIGSLILLMVGLFILVGLLFAGFVLTTSREK